MLLFLLVITSVNQFQVNHRLTKDGISGPNTLNTLVSEVRSRNFGVFKEVWY